MDRQGPDAGDVLVVVGTKTGVWRFWSDRRRQAWQHATSHASAAVHAGGYDTRDGRLYIAANGNGGGARVEVSEDVGCTWRRLGDFPTSVDEVWQVQPGHATRPAELWAGARDAALYHSVDRGETWRPVVGLNEHPTRHTWNAGGGGLILHTILPDAFDPTSLIACISAGGVYRSADAGATWRPINRGVRADFLEEAAEPTGSCQPETGQCVHKVMRHPTRPAVLFQQNHCGVYRSDDAGDSWVDISAGLPSRFGFPVAVHPHEPGTVYVVPLAETMPPFGPPDGQLAVWRSRDAGEHWQRLTAGLPTGSTITVLRDSLATDDADPAALYLGTSDGRLLYSLDAGDSWAMLAEGLPRILSVTAARLRN